MAASGQIHNLVDPPFPGGGAGVRGEPLIPIENKAGWSLRQLGYFGVEKYLLLPLEIKPQIVQIVA